MTSYRYVLISDISTEGCEDTNADGEYDPGSDIMYVELRDANGQTLAWGSTEEYEQADDPNNDYTDSAIIDGMAPSLIADGSEDDGCPDAADRFNAMTDMEQVSVMPPRWDARLATLAEIIDGLGFPPGDLFRPGAAEGHIAKLTGPVHFAPLSNENKDRT